MENISGCHEWFGEEVSKGKKYTQKMLYVVDFAHLAKVNGCGWLNNKMVNELIHNYKIKLNDFKGALRREKFTISVGMNYQLEFWN
jgi:DNA-directed RNA polymerase subunit beta